MSAANKPGGVPKVKKGKGGTTYVPSKQSNTLSYVLGGAAILVIVVLVIGGVFFFKHKADTNTAAGKASAAAQLDTSTSFTAGNADAKTLIDVFEDFQCPYCAQLEQASGSQIEDAIAKGQLRVRYHMLDFLNPSSASKNYSSRAAGAALAIAKSSLPADQKQKVWLAFHLSLFKQQPKEDAPSDWSNADLAGFAGDAAKQVGVTLPADVTSAISSGADTQEATATAATGLTQLTALGAQGTPTVLQDGRDLDALNDPNWLNTLLGN